MIDAPITRCGYTAIIGAPNAGKSTLLNRLIGNKIAIVSPKVQTTRSRILGMMIYESTQLIFVDTPGIFTPKEAQRFERAMVSAALGSIRDADVVLLMVDARKGVCKDTLRILDELARFDVSRHNYLLVLNKIDIVPKERLLELTVQLSAKLTFERVFMISAQEGDGTQDLLDYLAGQMPEGPWLYPEDQMTDVPMRQLAAEITREKLFLLTREELPYSIFVETEEWETKKDGSVRIGQAIYVRTESQKKIVIGQKGTMLKTIGEKARKDMARMLGAPVHLFLFVKVDEKWKENREFFTASGLSFS